MGVWDIIDGAPAYWRSSDKMRHREPFIRTVLRRGLGVLLIAFLAIAAVSGSSLRAGIVLGHRELVIRTMTLGDWTLRIERNSFSGDVRCHLEDRKHHIVYAANALGFRFKKTLDTLNAWVRIDDQVPHRWQDDMPELMRLQVPLDGASLESPTDGIVWIPTRQVDDANRVAIQPRPDKKPTIYHLHGFSGLRDVARDQGCTPEGRFVR